MPPKGERKRKALDLADRVRVIELSKNNKSARSIADDFGVGKTQIQSIIKNKDNIMKDYENNCNQGRKRQRKQTPHDDVNDLTWEWFKSTTYGPGDHSSYEAQIPKKAALVNFGQNEQFMQGFLSTPQGYYNFGGNLLGG